MDARRRSINAVPLAERSTVHSDVFISVFFLPTPSQLVSACREGEKMSFINKAIRSIKSKTYSDVENMVRDATNNDQWGPTTKQMAQIAKACRDSVEYMKIFAMIWKRVNDTDHPTHVTKVCLLVVVILVVCTTSMTWAT